MYVLMRVAPGMALEAKPYITAFEEIVDYA
jgi:hypothetical protein